MATAVNAQPSGAAPIGVAAISRAVVAAAADFVVTVERAVVGESKVRTARSNAWDAIQADRARAQARQEMDQLVRTLLANGPRTPLTPAGAASSTRPKNATLPTRRRPRTKTLATASN
jgi:hypothetical protein